MKRRVVCSKSADPYRDINHAFKEGQFDKDEFFYTVMNILMENSIPADDLKANVYVNEHYEDEEVDVKATFSWIFYPEDVSKKEFAKVAKNIENIFKKIYGKAFWFECDVVRYDDSYYDNKGYDVEMRFRTQFVLEPEEDL